MHQAHPFETHNKPLYDQMIEQGFKMQHNERVNAYHFVDDDGKYVCFPKGYITGPAWSGNGTPRPWYTSVYNGESWHQYQSKNRQEVVAKALAKAKEILQKDTDNVHT